MEKKWRDQSINCQRCAMALVKKSLLGEIITDIVYEKMREVFATDEIEAIEAYHALHVAAQSNGIRGCDYMTTAEMNAEIDRKGGEK